ncbi:MAG: hypothetical protein Q8909_14830 [Bacteroidota bacterium]|nr:hypothetical protein [Bacteroidota bacterium]
MYGIYVYHQRNNPGASSEHPSIKKIYKLADHTYLQVKPKNDTLYTKMYTSGYQQNSNLAI